MNTGTPTGRVLGVDYGDSWTGLALSDPGRFLASGIGFIREGGMRHTARRVAQVAREHGAAVIVVGLPRNMDGSEGPRAQAVYAFCELLQEACRAEEAGHLPEIVLYDERMSTLQAHRIMTMTETFGRRRREAVDTLSAQIILQDWLDREKNRREQH
ncbi:MAG: Holliday junction resolvase RuvX [Eubacteriales bacterium]